MTRLSFPKHDSGHFYLPVLLWGSKDTNPRFTFCLVDTGATKCTIPRTFNEKELGLSVDGSDTNVGTASGQQDLDFVTVPRMCVAELEIKTKEGSFSMKPTDLVVQNFEAWLLDKFIVGMNFLENFDIRLTRKGQLIVER